MWSRVAQFEMSHKEDLMPKSKPNLIELVRNAGVDVSGWSKTASGNFKHPAANPAYCYEWAFIQDGRVVVLNLWYDEIEEWAGSIYCRLNPRMWSAERSASRSLEHGAKSLTPRRAKRMDDAISRAFEEDLPVRVIVVDGPRRDYTNSKSQAASRVERRELDSPNWTVTKYDTRTGEGLVVRTATKRFVDQFSISSDIPPSKIDVIGQAWKRDPRVRELVLARAQGVCECCGARGFLTANGEIFLETHHVIPLSEGGMDTVRNVVAICPNDHREAHYGKRKDDMRKRLLNRLSALSPSR
jgi:5-methylcytosine-specific restriction protein A